jgi:predicted Fe-Mo cluster-binding NifX family protein
MGAMTKVAINLDQDLIGGGWGRARRVAVVDLVEGQIASWTEHEVAWDQSHDSAPSHGSHHARIVRFLRDQSIEAVLTGHMGPPMARMLDSMGVVALVGLSGPARPAAQALAAQLAQAEPEPPAT